MRRFALQEAGTTENEDYMEELKDLLNSILNEELRAIVISGPRQPDAYRRIRIRPVSIRGRLEFQTALWDGKKEFHNNYAREELIPNILAWMERDYRQLQAETTWSSASVLVSRKGKMTVKMKKRKEAAQKADLQHNRTKQYLLPEGTPVPFLVRLGVMTPEGKIVKAKYDKFRQINRFLEFIEDIRPVLPADREVSIIDFGCGKSYLTFAMYYYLHEVKGYDLRVTGLDLKQDVIEHCSSLAEEFGYDRLQFLTGDIADYTGADQVDLVVTLHACDTATDYAIAKAVGWNAKAILSVPCCQHELNRQMENEILEPVLKYGLLKERMAALVTDGLRASLLEECGYSVQVLEFIDMEHTPKNILIRAVQEPKKIASRISGKTEEEKAAELQRCMEFLHVNPTLRSILPEGKIGDSRERNAGITIAAGNEADYHQYGEEQE